MPNPKTENWKYTNIRKFLPKELAINDKKKVDLNLVKKTKSIIGDFMKKRKEAGGAGFQDSMLNLLNTLPSILKYLPVDKAQDARSFMLSFQYWLGGTPDNLRNFY